MEGVCMSLKLKIADAMNTYNVALLTLQHKGYRLWLEPSDENEDEYGEWCAEKDGRVFIAWDPLRLLGLVAMWEDRGDDWHRKKGEDNLYEKIPKDAGV
jgi:hypothetical protein